MKRRSTVAVVAAVLASGAGAVLVAPASAAQLPETIEIPGDFQGEGVATTQDGTFYAGDRDDGRIVRGVLREGTTSVEVFIDDPAVLAATGLKADERHGLLWVSGAQTGDAAVYDLETGEEVETLELTEAALTFINDVVVTRDAAYFTDSFNPVIYRVPVSKDGVVGDPETIALTGPAADFVAGFNINGIEATNDGGTLIVVNSATGMLFTVDAETGASQPIDLGGATVMTGDGILLDGGRLLVLQNGGGVVPSQVAVVQLRQAMRSGEIVDIVTNPDFEVATTLARSSGTLVAMNAQFGAPPDNPAEVVLFRLNGS